ncbi:MAG: copper chaperone PCu(A)C [Gallionella sp.]
MAKRFKGVIYLAAILLSSNVYAADIEILHAWARATAPGQDSAVVDLLLSSKQTTTLIGAKSTLSKSVELHTMQENHGVMEMREIKSVQLPAGKVVNFSETGTHLMLIGLKMPLKEGTNVPLTLLIQVSEKEVQEIKTEATVKPLVEKAHHHHH